MSMISVYYYLLVAKAMYIGESEQEDTIDIRLPARFALWYAC